MPDTYIDTNTYTYTLHEIYRMEEEFFKGVEVSGERKMDRLPYLRIVFSRLGKIVEGIRKQDMEGEEEWDECQWMCGVAQRSMAKDSFKLEDLISDADTKISNLRHQLFAKPIASVDSSWTSQESEEDPQESLNFEISSDSSNLMTLGDQSKPSPAPQIILVSFLMGLLCLSLLFL